jgi:hypothetical protein
LYKYYSRYENILRRPKFIPEIKKKLRVEKGYILTEGHNCKLMNLLHLYINMYYDFGYKNDMHMGELFVKRRVAEYRKVNSNDYEDIREEMVNVYMKLHMEYVCY